MRTAVTVLGLILASCTPHSVPVLAPVPKEPIICAVGIDIPLAQLVVRYIHNGQCPETNGTEMDWRPVHALQQQLAATCIWIVVSIERNLPRPLIATNCPNNQQVPPTGAQAP